MSTDDQFDDLLRDKFNSREVEFHEAHWSQAESMIVANERKQKNRKFIFWIFSLTVILSGFFYYTMNNAQKNVVIEEKQALHNPIISIVNTNKEKKDKNLNVGNSSAKVVTSDENKIQPIHKDMKSAVYSSQENGVAFTRENRRALKAAEASIRETHNTSSTNHSSKKSILVNDLTDVNIHHNGINLSQEFAQKDSLPALPNVGVPLIPASVIDSSKLTVLTAPEILTSKAETISKSSYAFIAGSYISRAFHNTEDESGWGMNAFGGISYAHLFAKEWSIEVEALYLEKGNLSSKKYFQSEFFQGEFGGNTENISISTKKLRYISIPICMQYHFNHMTQLIDIGFAYNYLITTYSSVQIAQKKTGSALNTVSKNQNGYVNGFEKQDFAILLGYGHQLSKKMHAHIRLHYGLNDLSKNEYFNNNIKDHNQGIQIYLQYKIK